MSHTVYTFFADGKINTKDIYDNSLTTINTQYEKYTYNDDATNTLNTKVFYFDGVTISGTETGTPDNKWHKLSSFVTKTDGVHAQDDLIYNNSTDALAGTSTGLVAHIVYSFFADGKINTKELYDNSLTTINTQYEKYTYNDDKITEVKWIP